jgi:hypothetical protein
LSNKGKIGGQGRFSAGIQTQGFANAMQLFYH